MRKRSTFIVLVALGLLVLLYALRVPIVERLIRHQLADSGIPSAQFVVERVSFHELGITDIAVGSGGELRAGKVVVTLNAVPPWEAAVTGVHVKGLRLNLDLTGNNPALGSLHGLIADKADGSPGRAVPVLPEVRLDDALITARLPDEQLTAELSGLIRSREGDAGHTGTVQHAGLDVIITGGFGQIAGALDATLGASGELQGEFDATGGAVRLPGARLSGLLGTATFTLRDFILKRTRGSMTAKRLEVNRANSVPIEFTDATLAFEADRDAASIDVDLLAPDQSLAFSLDGRADNYLETPYLEFQTTLRANAGSQIWSMADLTPPTAGAVEISLHGQSSTTPHEGGSSTWAERLRGAEVEAKGLILLQQIRLTSVLDELNGALAIDARVAGGTGELAITDGANAELKGLRPEWLESHGLPLWVATSLGGDIRLVLGGGDDNPTHVAWTVDETGTRLAGRLSGNASSTVSRMSFDTPVAASLAPDGTVRQLGLQDAAASLQTEVLEVPEGGAAIKPEIGLTGSIAGLPGRWAGRFEVEAKASRLTAGKARISGPGVTLPLTVEGGGNSWKLELARPGRAVQQGIGRLGAVSVDARRQWSIPVFDLTVTGGNEDASLQHSVVLEPGPLSVAIDRPDGAALVVTVKPRRIRIDGAMEENGYRANCTVDGVDFAVPEFQLSGKGMAADLACSQGHGTRLARFTVKSIEHLGQPALFAPLSLRGRVARTADGLAFDAIGSMAREPRLTFQGRHSIASGSGSIDFKLGRTAFASGALQPADVSPALSFMEETEGQAGFSGQLAWTRSGANSRGELELTGLSFSRKGMRVKDLNGSLDFTDLLALESRPRQSLSVGRIEGLGVPLDDIEMTYAVQTSQGIKLLVDEATVRLVGGSLGIESLSLGSDLESETVVEVSEIDLERLLGRLAIDGLAGTGRISGRIPLRLTGDEVTISAGALAAAGPGRLQFKSARAAELMSGAGDQAQLMLEALEDFHYSELTLALDKTAGHDLKATLSLLGSNPKVLDGRQFRLNINLESNIAKVLGAIGEGYRLSNEALRGVFRLR